MKKIKIPGTSFDAVICDNLNDIVKKATKYEPLRYNAKEVEKAIGKVIKVGYIDLNVWHAFTAYWKRYNVILSYAFYDPHEDYIFINLQAMGLRISKDCKPYADANADMLQNLANIVGHELIHYIFQNNIVKIFGFIRGLLIQWFEAFYETMFYDNIVFKLADANFSLSLDANINMIDKDAAMITRNNIERFLSILDRLKNSTYAKDVELIK
jgi:hypothetical protein